MSSDVVNLVGELRPETAAVTVCPTTGSQTRFVSVYPVSTRSVTGHVTGDVTHQSDAQAEITNVEATGKVEIASQDCGFSADGESNIVDCDDADLVAYTCLVCDRSFRSAHALREHCRRLHRKLKMPKLISESEISDRKMAHCDPASQSDCLVSQSDDLFTQWDVPMTQNNSDIARNDDQETKTMNKTDGDVKSENGTEVVTNSVELDAVKTIKLHTYLQEIVSEGDMSVGSEMVVDNAGTAMKLWICKLCGSVFQDKTSLQNHQREECATADVTNLIADDVTGELMKKENKEVVKTQSAHVCPECHKAFTRKATLTRHLRGQHPERLPFSCPRCRKLYSTMLSFNHHMKHSHGEDGLTCPGCDDKFYSEESLEQHNCAPVSCATCGESFSSRPLLKQHRKIHDAVTCFICQKSFAGKDSLNTHLVRMHDHTPEGVVRNINSWKSRHHERSDPCSVCGKTFCNAETLMYHMKIHAGQYDFECPTCGRSFCRKTQLTQHMEVHENHSYVCDICNKILTTKVSLRSHKMLMHRPKRHVCPICSQAFRGLHHLKQHVRTHTGERPHACEVCQQRFAQIATLQNHIRSVHSKVKPYNCNLCGDGFLRPCQLENHIETKHDTSKECYQCDICNVEYSSVRALKKHLLDKHLDQSPSSDDDD